MLGLRVAGLSADLQARTLNPKPCVANKETDSRLWVSDCMQRTRPSTPVGAVVPFGAQPYQLPHPPHPISRAAHATLNPNP